MRLPSGNLPPVDAFWSVSAYTAPDMNLIPSPARRYSVGKLPQGWQYRVRTLDEDLVVPARGDAHIVFDEFEDNYQRHV